MYVCEFSTNLQFPCNQRPPFMNVFMYALIRKSSFPKTHPQKPKKETLMLWLTKETHRKTLSSFPSTITSRVVTLWIYASIALNLYAFRVCIIILRSLKKTSTFPLQDEKNLPSFKNQKRIKIFL